MGNARKTARLACHAPEPFEPYIAKNFRRSTDVSRPYVKGTAKSYAEGGARFFKMLVEKKLLPRRAEADKEDLGSFLGDEGGERCAVLLVEIAVTRAADVKVGVTAPKGSCGLVGNARFAPEEKEAKPLSRGERDKLLGKVDARDALGKGLS